MSFCELPELVLKRLKVNILLLISGDIVAMEHFSGGGGGLPEEEEEEGEEKRKTHQDRLKEQIQKKNLEKVDCLHPQNYLMNSIAWF